MNQFAGYRWIAGAGLAALMALASPVSAQDYAPVEIAALKASPQRFWAKGIVFRDILVEAPDRRTVKVDGRVVTRFRTEALGEIYAAPEAMQALAALAPGGEALFSGTVSQRRGDYLIVVQRVAEAVADGTELPAQLEAIQRAGSTNEYNYIFEVLDTVLDDARKQLFAHSTGEDLAIGDLLRPGSPGRDKVANSVRAALRNLEDNAKIPAQEFLVSLMISMMALQEGYVETAAPVYEPMEDGMAMPEYAPLDGGGATDAIDAPVSREEWDLLPAPAPEAEPMDAGEPEAALPDASDLPVEELDAMTEEMEFPSGVEEVETVEDAPSAEAMPEAEVAEEEPAALEATIPPVTGGIEEVDLMAADDAFWGMEPAPAVVPDADTSAATESLPEPEPVPEPASVPEAEAPPVAPMMPAEESVEPAAEAVLEPAAEIAVEAVEPVVAPAEEKPKKKAKKKKKKEEPLPPPVEETAPETAPVADAEPVVVEDVPPPESPVEEGAEPVESVEPGDPVESDPNVDYSQPLRLR